MGSLLSILLVREQAPGQSGFTNSRRMHRTSVIFLVAVLMSLGLFSFGNAAQALPAAPPGITATASAVDCGGNWGLTFNSTSSQAFTVQWYDTTTQIFYAGAKPLPANGSVYFQSPLELESLSAGQTLTVQPEVLVPTASGTVSDTYLPAVKVTRPFCGICPTLQFVGVRGSGEKATDSGGYGSTVDAVRQQVLANDGTADSFPVNYPAIPVPRDVQGAIATYGGSAYQLSINRGKNALTSFLNAFHARCSTVPIALVGYSQGAQVAGDVYQSINSSVRGQIRALALIGDPRFNPKQMAVDVGTYDHGLSGIWKLKWPNTERWIATGTAPVHSYCQLNDPVCNYSAGNLQRALPTSPVARMSITWMRV